MYWITANPLHIYKVTYPLTMLTTLSSSQYFGFIDADLHTSLFQNVFPTIKFQDRLFNISSQNQIISI